MTTKVKKKGVLAYQEAPQRKDRADCSSRNRRGSLQFKSTNPLQDTEKCSWPKINLTVPPSCTNPAACNNLDLRTQKKILFHILQGFGSLMIFIRGLAVFTPGLLYILSQWENDGAQRKSQPGSQLRFEVADARYHSELLLGR